MALTGPQALSSLDDAVRDIRREEDDIAKRLARSAERVAKLREAEAELYRELAAMRLKEPEALTGSLGDAEKRARAILDTRAADMAAAEDALRNLDETVAGKVRKRQELLGEIDRAQGELKALSATIAKTVAADPAYMAKREEMETLNRVAEESLKKTEVAEADREQKGRPYRDDPLFMYLWERGYGTKNYKANNFTRYLDSLVARLVRYDRARPNFAMLNDIPLRLREHAERQKAAAETAEEELDALEAQAIDAAGGKDQRQALKAAQTKIAALDADILAIEDERDEKAVGFRHMAEGRDPKFEEAQRMLATSLEQKDIASLMAEARRTPTPGDDAIVKRIDDSRSQLDEETRESAEHKARLKVLAARRRELEDIAFEFKKARYDDPRSTFREDNLAGDLLNEFLRGAITAGNYWAAWQKSQRWRPGTTDWGGGVGLPRSGRSDPPSRDSSGSSWPGSISPPGGPWSSGGGNPWGGGGSGGGFSRPRTGSRGNRTGGGFKTGGGF
ncbi:MAG: hypothetical protein KKH72_04035 [Alphaproteobacteria bacterium]|nr:hypothetical protein [Alphaproteobacteria bacterium]